MNPSLKTAAIALAAGLLFGVGLAVSGMFDPAKVLGFLDLAAIAENAWDPSLALVMAGALAVTLPAFRIARRWRQPAAAPTFHNPGAAGIDRKLVLGAVIFGAGWGLVGYCPGPALAALAFGATGTFVFVLAMVAGMLLQALVARPA
ncbi:MAG TPA: DUF6691 family protein [Dongiaceae bacterium]|nr:DUF6691 family protein [Dongiaceae bacterium]